MRHNTRARRTPANIHLGSYIRRRRPIHIYIVGYVCFVVISYIFGYTFCYCKILARGLDLDFWLPGLGADTLWCVHESGRVAAWHLGPNITKCLLTTCPHPDTATVVRGRVVGVWQYNHRQAGRRTIKSRTGCVQEQQQQQQETQTDAFPDEECCMCVSFSARLLCCVSVVLSKDQPTNTEIRGCCSSSNTNKPNMNLSGGVCLRYIGVQTDVLLYVSLSVV